VKILLQQRTNKSPETVTGSHLERQVDELFETFNDIAKMLGRETIKVKTEDVSETPEVELAKV
jgi:hypothetical protein